MLPVKPEYDPQNWPPSQEIHEKYMESKNLKWKDFCKEVSLGYPKSMAVYPVWKWREEKAALWQQEHMDELFALAFKAKNEAQKNFLETVIDYPVIADYAIALIKSKLIATMNELNKAPEAEKPIIAKNINAAGISFMMRAYKDAIAGKKAALMIPDWQISSVEKMIKEVETERQDDTRNGIKFTMDGKEMTSADLIEATRKWLDKPVEKVEEEEDKPIDVNGS